MATKLVNMKVDRSSVEEKSEPASIAADRPMYPWGLSISLDEDALEKLGLEADDLKIGEKRLLIAKVEVTSISSNKSQNGGDSSNVSLQITDCCLEDAPTGKDATSIYDKAEG